MLATGIDARFVVALEMLSHKSNNEILWRIRIQMN